jgi:23S rRNA pseudouridine2605 synthase
MAKKSTWEKRAKKVQKEEHLVLGGNTNRKKEGVKKKYPGSRLTTAGYKGKKSEDGTESTGEKSFAPKRDFKGGKPESRPAGLRGKSELKASKYTLTREGDDKRPASKGKPAGNDRFQKPERGGFKGSEKPFSKFRKDEKDGAFKSKGKVDSDFRKEDHKKSHTKFLKDEHFDGFEQRGQSTDELIRLNKYLAIAGICSRREADTFIEQGMVTVNGEVVTVLGTKVKNTDEVRYAGERVKAETLRYVLLNKPKDCITTLSDERGRTTVMGLVKSACRERIFPVGRLDRNTTGLLLLTNDGDLAKKLTHPSHEVRKVYHVITDKNVSIADLKKLESGVELDDGIAKADAALFVGDGSVRTEIGLEIHSGRNRIVRRMFEAMGYEVTRLDRAAFAGLGKKGLPRGRWRFLTEKEVSYLRML